MRLTTAEVAKNVAIIREHYPTLRLPQPAQEEHETLEIGYRESGRHTCRVEEYFAIDHAGREVCMVDSTVAPGGSIMQPAAWAELETICRMLNYRVELHTSLWLRIREVDIVLNRMLNWSAEDQMKQRVR
jgi:hypothetical protein